MLSGYKGNIGRLGLLVGQAGGGDQEALPPACRCFGHGTLVDPWRPVSTAQRSLIKEEQQRHVADTAEHGGHGDGAPSPGGASRSFGAARGRQCDRSDGRGGGGGRRDLPAHERAGRRWFLAHSFARAGRADRDPRLWAGRCQGDSGVLSRRGLRCDSLPRAARRQHRGRNRGGAGARRSRFPPRSAAPWPWAA